MARTVGMRPNFVTPLVGDGTAVFARLRTMLESDGCPFVGQVLETHAYVRIGRERRSLLSPNLDLELESAEGNARLRGRFTPHPSVWMGFMGVFGVLGMLGFAGLMHGLAQMTAHESPWGLLAVPIAGALIAFVYGASFIGQGLSADEMYELRTFVDEAVRGARS